MGTLDVPETVPTNAGMTQRCGYIGVIQWCIRIPSVRSVGPIPRIPSTPEKPEDLLATPMLCEVMTKPVPIVTVSVYSVPAKVCHTLDVLEML